MACDTRTPLVLILASASRDDLGSVRLLAIGRSSCLMISPLTFVFFNTLFVAPEVQALTDNIQCLKLAFGRIFDLDSE